MAVASANPGVRPYSPRMRDLDTIDSELRLVAALRRAARERGGPLPSIDVADALLDEHNAYVRSTVTPPENIESWSTIRIGCMSGGTGDEPYRHYQRALYPAPMHWYGRWKAAAMCDGTLRRKAARPARVDRERHTP
jgi:hypothetical protein